MLSDAIQGAYDLLINDPRLKDDIGTNTKVDVLNITRTLENEPTCTPFITFNVDSISGVSIVSLGKKDIRKTPLKIICGVEDYEDPFDTLIKLDALLKNVESILLESPKLGGVVYNSKMIQEAYGYIFDNEGNPFSKVCEITFEVSEIIIVNLC